MKKRLFPLLLALMLLLTLCTPFAQAEGRTLSITSASGRAGETVSVQVRLTNNGVDVPGAVAIQTFGASDEEANVTFSAPIRVDSVPANLEVIVNDAGYTFEELALNVYRLGDAT